MEDRPPVDSMELFTLMDRAGLSASNLMTTRQPTQKIVSDIRTKLALQLRDYIEERERRYGSQG